jgi:hypothetical protein
LEALEDRLTPTSFTTLFSPVNVIFPTTIFPTSGLTFAVVSSGAQNFWTLRDPSHFANLNSVPAVIVSQFDVVGLLSGTVLPPVTTVPIGTVITVPATTIVSVPVGTVLSTPTTVIVDDPGAMAIPNPANEQFVNALYQGLLGRQADAAGLAYWEGLLNAGASRQDVAEQIQSSPEFLQDEVAAAYQSVLHRAVDPLGLSAWTGFLAAGHSSNELAAQLAGSAEFSQTQGASNDAFLAALYHDAFGRSVDPIGQAAWGNALAKGESREQVAAAIFSSSEFLGDQVNGEYHQLLGRDATAAELDAAIAALQQGTPQSQIVAGIAASTEFANRVGG